jgi:hypothetical protein
VEIVVWATNTIPLGRILLPVEYSGDLNLVYDSYSTEGCRTDGFGEKDLIDHDPVSKTIGFQFTPRPGGPPLYMAAGTGPIVKLNFYLMGGTAGGSATIRLSGLNNPYPPTFVARAPVYTPATIESLFRIPCCLGRVGDTNGAGGDEPTIGDSSVMIDAKFITGSCDGIIVCLTEADINLSGGADPTCDDITIGDISILIDYLFITGPSLGLPDCL